MNPKIQAEMEGRTNNQQFHNGVDWLWKHLAPLLAQGKETADFYGDESQGNDWMEHVDDDMGKRARAYLAEHEKVMGEI